MITTELTNSELTACCCAAERRITGLLKGVDNHITQLRLNPDFSDTDAKRMQYNAYRSLFEVMRICTRRGSQHFYPTVSAEFPDTPPETWETMIANEPKEDYRATLLSGVQAYISMVLLQEEIERQKCCTLSDEFSRISEICEEEAKWLAFARKIYIERRTPENFSPREKEEKLPPPHKPECICVL